jgi:hypothetical protein
MPAPDRDAQPTGTVTPTRDACGLLARITTHGATAPIGGARESRDALYFSALPGLHGSPGAAAGASRKRRDDASDAMTRATRATR